MSDDIRVSNAMGLPLILTVLLAASMDASAASHRTVIDERSRNARSAVSGIVGSIQSRTGNRSHTAQVGRGNRASTVQSGRGNLAATGQFGRGFSSSTTQSGGQVGSVTQVGDGSGNVTSRNATRGRFSVTVEVGR